jgi:hypothetical protein
MPNSRKIKYWTRKINSSKASWAYTTHDVTGIKCSSPYWRRHYPYMRKISACRVRHRLPAQVLPHMSMHVVADFYTGQRRQKRTYSHREQVTAFLQGLVKESDHVSAIQKLLQDLAQIPLEVTELPNRIRFPDLPMTLLTHPAILQPSSNVATINVTRATYRRPHDQTTSPRFGNRGSGGDGVRGRSRERDDSRERSRSTSAPLQTSRQKDLHKRENQYSMSSATVARRTVIMYQHVSYYHAWRRCWTTSLCIHTKPRNISLSSADPNTPMRRKKANKAAREHIIKVLQSSATHEDIVNQLTGDNSDDEYSASIYRIQHRVQPTPEPTAEIMCCQFVNDLGSTIHPFPHLLQLPERTLCGLTEKSEKSENMTVELIQTQSTRDVTSRTRVRQSVPLETTVFYIISRPRPTTT